MIRKKSTDEPHPDGLASAVPDEPPAKTWRDAEGWPARILGAVWWTCVTTAAYMRGWASAPGQHTATLVIGLAMASSVFAVRGCTASASDGPARIPDAAVAATAEAEYAARQTEPAPGEATAMPAPQTSELPDWLPAGVRAHSALIHQAAADVGLDPLALALLQSVECPSGDAACTSVSGARGLAQVMPGTATGIEAATGYPCTSQAHDPLTSLRCGGWYFAQRLKSAGAIWRDGDEAPALGAAGIGYNAGPLYIPQVVAHVQAGGEVCAVRLTPVPGDRRPMAPVEKQARDWCRLMVDGWHRAKGS